MKRSPVLALALALSFAACNGDDTADPPTTPASAVTSTVATTAPPSTALPTSVAAPTTTSPSTTGAAPPTPAPTTVTTQAPGSAPIGDTDWRAVLETLGRRRQELYANPDVSRTAEVCGGGSPCAEQLDVQLGDMAGKGWHIEGGDPYTVLEAELEDFDGATLEESQVVTIVAIVQRQADAGTIIDASGAVVAEVEPDTAEGFNPQARVLLARAGTPGDEWRILDTTRIQEVAA